jgi:2-oxoisovalerate dehydrogenase E2 component (dihydrolipoyl transacylase)
VESKSILEIAEELERLRAAAEKGALTPADFQGGTISLSNIGSIGGTYLHPVIVPGEVCIGAIGKSQIVPRFGGPDGKEVVATEIMACSWNADHRVIDGATMARFVRDWKNLLENPHVLFGNLK